MKSFVLWTLCIAFCGLAVMGIHMQEWAIAAVFGVISIGLLWATPSNGSSGLSL